MNQLFLGNYKNSNENFIRQDVEKKYKTKEFDKYNIVVAFSDNFGFSEGSFFILKEKVSGDLFEIQLSDLNNSFIPIPLSSEFAGLMSSSEKQEIEKFLDKETKRLFIGDYLDQTEEEIKENIIQNYEAKSEEVNKYDVIVACLNGGGCDEDSFFLLREKYTGKLFENTSSHCSCYGFEGTFTPQECTLEYLKSDHFNPNSSEIKEFVKTL